MKILFITACLEPGRDGVGDYTRRLAGECVRQGHECRAMALNDRFIRGMSSAPAFGRDAGIVRLSRDLAWRERLSVSEKEIETFDPDWTSLQFVCYGFNEKGVIGPTGLRLASLFKGRRTHVMFHELWVGAAGARTIREKIVGEIQKPFIIGLANKISPRLVHTNTEVYAATLKRFGVNAGVLPLFGNIPVGSGKGDEWLFERMREGGVEITPEVRKDFWLMGFFGAIHPSWSFTPLMDRLREASRVFGKKVCLISGGNLRGGEPIWKKMSSAYGKDIFFLELGCLPENTVSEFLNSLDFGVTTTSYELLAKSGSYIAMIEHGLPVIIGRDDVHFKLGGTPRIPGQERICRLDEGFSRRLAAAERQIPTPMLGDVTGRFLGELIENS